MFHVTPNSAQFIIVVRRRTYCKNPRDTERQNLTDM